MNKTTGAHGLVKTCFLGFLLYVYLGTQNLIPLPAVLTDAVIIFVILASSIMDGWRIRFKTDEAFRFGIRHFMLPVLLIFVYSIPNQLVRGLSFDYLQNTITTCVRFLAYYCVGMITVRVFGKRTVEYLLLMGIVAYVPAFIRHFQMYGLAGGITILLSLDVFHANLALEIHTLTYIFGFIALYYAYRLCVEKEKGARWLFWLSVLLTMVGVKRIVLAALVFAIIMMLILNRFKPSQRYNLMHLGCWLLIASSFAFLYLVHSGILEQALSSFGVNTNDRLFLWGLVRDKYTISPLFLGHGISYGTRIMEYVWKNTHLIHMVALHCDIIRLYLGVGFVGSLLYWYNFFYATMRRVNRICSTNAAMFAFTMAVYFYINSATSNEGLNPITNGIFFAIIYTVVSFGPRRESITKASGGDLVERTAEDSV